MKHRSPVSPVKRAPVGRLMVNGLQMAMSVIERREEKQGFKIELTFADDKSTPEGAVEALNATGGKLSLVKTLEESRKQ